MLNKVSRLMVTGHWLLPQSEIEADMAWRRTSGPDLEVARARSRSRPREDEKQYYNHDDIDQSDEFNDHDCSETSSRSASSQRPMLSNAFERRPRRTQFLLRLPSSIMKYTCLFVALGLVMFIMMLVKMSWNADREVHIAKAQGKLQPKPATWEEFPFLNRYWGGIQTLVPYNESTPEYPTQEDKISLRAPGYKQGRSTPSSVKFNPYPDYSSSGYTKQFGKKVDCYLDEAGKLSIPRVQVYEGRVSGFPEPVMGSDELLGIRHDICYDRFGRLGPYGMGYSLVQGGTGAMMDGDREGAAAVWAKNPEVDFRDVKWRNVQDRCFRSNSHRFNTSSQPPSERFRTMHVGAHANRDDGLDTVLDATRKNSHKAGAQQLTRTAVVIRTWTGYDYTAEDLMYLRALISELVLLSGGEYSLHFLIHVKDENLPIWSDSETYERVLRESLPEEFHGLGTLWSEKQMFLMYPNIEETLMRDLPVHGAYRSTYMPVQYFAYQHPEYDYFWNWEMDVRNTGHWYHLFDRVGKWAKKQPRKYLWERNSRFYIPAEHGSWEDFSHAVRLQTEHGISSASNIWSKLGAEGMAKGKVEGDRPIWGPEYPQDDDVAFEGDPEPPTPMDKDQYEWGVGEDADLITFNPVFDPESTTWILSEDTSGYNRSRGQPPRRAAIIGASRLSRKLLLTMHRETSTKRHTMFSEMWPASCALHHGLKAVYAPHAVYIDRKWPLKYLESVFNGGRNGATGASRISVFGEREHNFRGTTWYYNAGFSEVLWHRWLGMTFNNDGGQEYELDNEGRMCLPGMLLHPIKRVELPQENRLDP